MTMMNDINASTAWLNSLNHRLDTLCVKLNADKRDVLVSSAIGKLEELDRLVKKSEQNDALIDSLHDKLKELNFKYEGDRFKVVDTITGEIVEV